METIIRRCAGLDVHKASVVACVRLIDENGELQSFTQSFGTAAHDLLLLGDWLSSYAVTIVGMEATGVYWKPVYTLLETDFECWLLNAQHLQNVPGRKTDVADAVWIAQLVAHGLVRPSFVPPREIRELREVTRYRKSLIQERSREAQRLHKVLEDSGIKLSSVATDILGVSGRAMLGALIAGTHDPDGPACVRATTSQPANTSRGRPARVRSGCVPDWSKRQKPRPGHHVLKRNTPYVELGADYFENRRAPDAYRTRLVHQLERLGFDVAITPRAA